MGTGIRKFTMIVPLLLAIALLAGMSGAVSGQVPGEPFARTPEKDIILTIYPPAYPTGIWSDGTTLWVSDRANDKVFAFDLATKLRDAAKNFNTLDGESQYPFGLWSDGTTMWVADSGDFTIYAHSMATKARDAEKDFNSLGHATNGIWSDGTTMWAVSSQHNKIFAYDLATKRRVAAKDFDTLDADNDGPGGIWSDGTPCGLRTGLATSYTPTTW